MPCNAPPAGPPSQRPHWLGPGHPARPARPPGCAQLTHTHASLACVQHEGTDAYAGMVAAAAARKRTGHSALAQKLLKECAIDQADIMFCRGSDGNLVQLGSGAYGQVYKAFLRGVTPVAVKVFQTQVGAAPGGPPAPL